MFSYNLKFNNTRYSSEPNTTYILLDSSLRLGSHLKIYPCWMKYLDSGAGKATKKISLYTSRVISKRKLRSYCCLNEQINLFFRLFKTPSFNVLNHDMQVYFNLAWRIHKHPRVYLFFILTSIFLSCSFFFKSSL